MQSFISFQDEISSNNCYDAEIGITVQTGTWERVDWQGSEKEIGTTITYKCPARRYYFGYGLPDDFVSYSNTTNIKAINVTCTQDR